MKKYLCTLSIVFISFLGSHAQSLQLLDTTGATHGSTGTVAQQSYTYTVDTSAAYPVKFNVKNTTSSSISVKVRKYLISNPAGDAITFCIGLNCYPPTTTLSAATTVPSNTILANGFLTDFTAVNTPNTAKVIYTIFNTANPNDSTSVTINYNVSANAGAGIKQIANNYYVSDIAPNPASSFVSIAYTINNTNQEASVKIYNMLGSLVKTIPLETYSNSTKVDVNSLEEGIYVYSVVVGGKAVKTSRLVVAR